MGVDCPGGKFMNQKEHPQIKPTQNTCSKVEGVLKFLTELSEGQQQKTPKNFTSNSFLQEIMTKTLNCIHTHLHILNFYLSLRENTLKSFLLSYPNIKVR